MGFEALFVVPLMVELVIFYFLVGFLDHDGSFLLWELITFEISEILLSSRRLL